jgi:nucleotide-binding universal stress UspA family protein
MKMKPTTKRGEVLVKLNRRDDHLIADSVKEAEVHGWPFQVKNILVPVDLSEPSHKVLNYAVPLAEKFGARIVLVHVVEPRIYPENLVIPAEIEEMNVRLLQYWRDLLEKLRRRAIGPSIKCDVRAILGKPYQEIVDVAKAEKADLIVIATHGYKGLKRAFLGSTAERVVRYAECPVLTVRGREDPAG